MSGTLRSKQIFHFNERNIPHGFGVATLWKKLWNGGKAIPIVFESTYWKGTEKVYASGKLDPIGVDTFQIFDIS